ncbi:hypothetical protein PFLmoz3_02780 [Pseudomonas fluorescens]|uniref:Uncharacterized protein n=1 Tax=Pseudomonas fluorescens TaxID=294 RepID=A0A109LGP7_PSEFL|nr:hypothetical protein PFLmoz3_02780 [Pseudomonas fluorescens]
MTGPARPKAMRQVRCLSGRRNFRPLTNSENSTATSVRCSIQRAEPLMSRCSRSTPRGPMAIPSNRHTAEVVTGIQRKYEEVRARVSSTAPNTANHRMKVIVRVPGPWSMQL